MSLIERNYDTGINAVDLRNFAYSIFYTAISIVLLVGCLIIPDNYHPSWVKWILIATTWAFGLVTRYYIRLIGRVEPKDWAGGKK